MKLSLEFEESLPQEIAYIIAGRYDLRKRCDEIVSIAQKSGQCLSASIGLSAGDETYQRRLPPLGMRPEAHNIIVCREIDELTITIRSTDDGQEPTP